MPLPKHNIAAIFLSCQSRIVLISDVVCLLADTMMVEIFQEGADFFV